MTRLHSSSVGWAIWVVPPLYLVAVLGSVASAQIESRVGTWELNLAKSTFSPGPPPKRQTLTFQAAGPHWTALLQGIDASGKPINPDVNNLIIDFDGRDHPTQTVDYETTAWKRISANKYEVIRKKGGKSGPDLDQRFVDGRQDDYHYDAGPQRRRTSNQQRQGLRQAVAELSSGITIHTRSSPFNCRGQIIDAHPWTTEVWSVIRVRPFLCACHAGRRSRTSSTRRPVENRATESRFSRTSRKSVRGEGILVAAGEGSVSLESAASGRSRRLRWQS